LLYNTDAAKKITMMEIAGNESHFTRPRILRPVLPS
jgi:hypothetical protein